MNIGDEVYICLKGRIKKVEGGQGHTVLFLEVEGRPAGDFLYVSADDVITKDQHNRGHASVPTTTI